MSAREITDLQARAIVALSAALGRPAPDLGKLAMLTHRQAGDLILQLRAEARGGQR